MRPSFSFLKHKTEVIQQANQDYPYLDFNLNDYLPYCTLRLTSEAVSTENILNECKQGEGNEKESSGSEVENEEKEAENEDNLGYKLEKNFINRHNIIVAVFIYIARAMCNCK